MPKKATTHIQKTAGYQGTCHADDITGADRGSQCGAQRLELGDGLIISIRVLCYVFVVKDAAYCIFEPVSDVG